jgi:mono/diheme cytochrome c family protein/glucose/arabinose dehydrogenase
MLASKNYLQIFLVTILLSLPVRAQKGDKSGEVQAPLVPAEKIPPSPVLSPEDALKSFKLQPGFQIQLVAAEPMVNEPVAIQFDPNGRLWVLEMQGFMPTADGVGEDQPVATISMLEDTNGDGRMDKRTEVVTGLVMPRAFLVLSDGILVAEPPRLWFYKFVSDAKVVGRLEVTGDYAREADPKLGLRTNPEHAANSLMWALDNWIYSANYTWRFRRVNGEWKREATAFRGQWGLSQDDHGRLVYNSNSDQFRIDLSPSQYLRRNPNFPNAAGANFDPIKNQFTFPVRVTPGVNRGYQRGMLRPDGTLEKVTAACGPVIYRGENFPKEFYGNAFVCEPSANLVKRDILEEKSGTFSGRQAYTNAEFLASTDEWFRPVNACNAPDGALYLVDIHHGIVQHRYFLTSYLRKQAESRGMATAPRHLGRIFRVVYAGGKLNAAPHLGNASPAEIVAALAHANGWWRDTAQRLLVEKNDSATVPLLENAAITGPNPLGRLHALWTLEGMDRLDERVVLKSLGDSNATIRATAIRLAEKFFKTEDQEEVVTALLRHLADSGFEPQLQLALTLGELGDAKSEAGLVALARRSAANVFVRDAILSGLGRRELEFLEKILAQKSRIDAGLLKGLAQCVFTEKKAERVNRMFELAAAAPPDTQSALLDGMVLTAPSAGKNKTPVKPRPILFATEPSGFVALKKSVGPPMTDRINKISGLVTWPGQPGYVPPPPVTPLTPAQEKQFEAGRELFGQSCAACHQPHGLGQEGLAPPLVDSEWVVGPEQRLIRIALRGVHGPLSVKGKTYEMEMPGLSVFEDEPLAAILTYVRREWGHTANPIEAASVKKIRDETGKHEDAWTEAELLKIK